MTRKEVAARALELREDIQSLFEPPDMQDAESCRAYGQNLRDFDELYTALTHQVFNLARMTRE
jgi:hypothetical protein